MIYVFDIGLSAKGATELVKLAQRMTLKYYTGITGSSSTAKWEIIQVENVAQNMIFMTRKNLNEPGEHTGIVLSAATSVWFPVNQQTLFAFLSHPNYRHEWDILTHNTSMEEIIRIQKAKRHGNIISLLRIIVSLKQNLVFFGLNGRSVYISLIFVSFANRGMVC